MKAARVASKPLWPWDPINLTVGEIAAIKGMAAQNRLAFEAIVFKICGVDRMSFTAGGEDGRRATDFAEGRRWPGNTLRQIVEMPAQVNPRGAPPEIPADQS